MGPCPAKDHASDAVVGNSHRLCDGQLGFSGREAAAYGADLSWGKFGGGSINATVYAPLSGTVHHVVGTSPDEQVIGAHALSVVALVADHQSFWDCAIGKLPSESVGGNHLVGNRESSVAIGHNAADPLPTCPRSFDALPEVISGVSPLGVPTITGTKTPASCGFPCLALESVSTSFACFFDPINTPHWAPLSVVQA